MGGEDAVPPSHSEIDLSEFNLKLESFPANRG